MALNSSRSISRKISANPNSLNTFEDRLNIPPPLRPLIRAYVLGYASSTAPRLISLILKHVNRNHQKRVRIGNADEPPKHFFFHSLLGILHGGLDLKRFPTSCAVLVGGSTLLQIPIRKLLERLVRGVPSHERARFSRGIATFVSAYLALVLLQSKESPEYIDRVPPNTYDKLTGKAIKSTQYGGRTLDLTLFALTRALDVLVGSFWQTLPKTGTHQLISYLTDPFLFATSCSLVMWSWFYSPDRLPRNYYNWITTAAAVDPHLINALRVCRRGDLVYGQTYPPNAPGLLLQDMCKEYGYPIEWGDPSKTVPFPCTLVHMHCGPSCEYHALSRFLRSFKWALEYNLPLNLILKLRNPSMKKIKRAIIASVRSSAFLATFIALFYYGVCLCRTRFQQVRFVRKLFMLFLGIKEKKNPHPDFEKSLQQKSKEESESSDSSGSTITPSSASIITLESAENSTASLTQNNPSSFSTPAKAKFLPISPDNQLALAIDSGLCIASGCLLCGWSILLESSAGTRRSELSLFVMPRALRTLFTKRYPKDKEWIERLVFASSAAVVVDAVLGVKNGKGMVISRGKGAFELRRPRGVFGRLLEGVFRT